MSMTTKYALLRATQIVKVNLLATGGTSAIRLISPPGIGALACGGDGSWSCGSMT
jgi:hypothetical protein